MKRQNIYDSENYSQFKQNQSMAADANAKQRRREGERKRLRKIESGRAGEIANERERAGLSISQQLVWCEL